MMPMFDMGMKQKKPDRMLCDPDFKAMMKAAASAQGKSLIDFTREYAKEKKGVLRQLEQL